MYFQKKPRQILKNNNVYPNKLLGQNFLRDKKVLRRIIDAADLNKDDWVLEIGPGGGILTRELAGRAGYVLAVEKDKTLAEILKKQLTEENIENVEIVEGDILKFSIFNFQFSNEKKSNPLNPPLFTPLKQRGGGGLNYHPYKVVANIPYYLTSHLIRLLLEAPNPPQDMILMVQKEVAQRICAAPPGMSLLAVAAQFYAETKIIASVSKNSFWPKPKVDSAIIRITPKVTPPLQRGIEGDLNPSQPPFKKGGEKDFFRILHAGFSHPRKQLLNNLSSGLNIKREKIAEILQNAGLNPQQRAETLSVKDWIKLADIIKYHRHFPPLCHSRESGNPGPD